MNFSVKEEDRDVAKPWHGDDLDELDRFALYSISSADDKDTASARPTEYSSAGESTPEMDELDSLAMGIIGEPKQSSKLNRISKLAPDLGLLLAKGTAKIPDAMAGIVDLVTSTQQMQASWLVTGKARTGYFGKMQKYAMDAVGLNIDAASDFYDSALSDEQKAATKQVDDATGFVDTAMAYIKNPSVALMQAAESLPLMAVTWGVTGAAMKSGAIASRFAPGTIAAAVEGSLSAGSIQEEMRRGSEEGLTTAKQSGMAAVAGVGVALVGAASNKLGVRLGIEDIEVPTARKAMLEKAVKEKAKRLPYATRLALATLKEGGIEEGGQTFVEATATNIGEGKPIMEGVGKQVVGGIAAGGVMGAMANIKPQADANAKADAAIRSTLEDFGADAQDIDALSSEDRKRVQAALIAGLNAEQGHKLIKTNEGIELFDKLAERWGYNFKGAQEGISPNFNPPMIEGPDGKPVPNWTSFGGDGRSIDDAESGIVITQDGKGEITVWNRKANQSVPAESEQEAVELARNMSVYNQAVDRSREKKLGFLSDAAARLAGKVEFQAFNTFDELMAAHGKEVKSEKKNTAGVKLADGTVAVVLDNIGSPYQMLKTVLHEAGVHIGIREVFQDKAARDEFLGKIDKREIAPALELVKKKGYDPTSVAGIEEALAYMYEKRTANPTTYQRGVAALHDQFRKLFPKMQFSRSDIEVIMSRAQRQVRGEGGIVENRGGTAPQNAPEAGAAQPGTEQGPQGENAQGETLEGPQAAPANVVTPSEDGKSQKVTLVPEGVAGRGEAVAAAVGQGAQPGEVSSAIERAENETETQPTESQKESGNYKKGRFKLFGLEFAVENPKGSIRSGIDNDGRKWKTEMKNTYGYFANESEGKDGDKLDFFLGDSPENGKLFIVDQVDPKTGKFDEHKVMVGFATKESAEAAYRSNYERDWNGFGGITESDIDTFKEWVRSSGKKTKPFSEYKGVGVQNAVQPASPTAEPPQAIAPVEQPAPAVPDAPEVVVPDAPSPTPVTPEPPARPVKPAVSKAKPTTPKAEPAPAPQVKRERTKIKVVANPMSITAENVNDYSNPALKRARKQLKQWLNDARRKLDAVNVKRFDGLLNVVQDAIERKGKRSRAQQDAWQSVVREATRGSLRDYLDTLGEQGSPILSRLSEGPEFYMPADIGEVLMDDGTYNTRQGAGFDQLQYLNDEQKALLFKPNRPARSLGGMDAIQEFWSKLDKDASFVYGDRQTDLQSFFDQFQNEYDAFKSWQAEQRDIAKKIRGAENPRQAERVKQYREMVNMGARKTAEEFVEIDEYNEAAESEWQDVPQEAFDNVFDAVAKEAMLQQIEEDFADLASFPEEVGDTVTLAGVEFTVVSVQADGTMAFSNEDGTIVVRQSIEAGGFEYVNRDQGEARQDVVRARESGRRDAQGRAGEAGQADAGEAGAAAVASTAATNAAEPETLTLASLTADEIAAQKEAEAARAEQKRIEQEKADYIRARQEAPLGVGDGGRGVLKMNQDMLVPGVTSDTPLFDQSWGKQAAQKQPATPADERVAVVGIGDLHGESPDKLDASLERDGVLQDGKWATDKTVVQVGDVTDRGKHTNALIRRMRALQRQSGNKLVRIIGNHDFFHIFGQAEQVRGKSDAATTAMLREDVLAGRVVAAWAEGDTLYTHAGLDLSVFPEYEGMPIQDIVADLNRRLVDAVRGGDIESDPLFGNKGIIWTRGKIENPQFRQVVGHTPAKDGKHSYKDGDRVKYIDTGRVFGGDDALFFNTVANIDAVGRQQAAKKHHKVYYNGKTLEVTADEKVAEFRKAAMRVRDNLKSGEVGYVETPNGKFYEISTSSKMAKPVSRPAEADAPTDNIPPPPKISPDEGLTLRKITLGSVGKYKNKRYGGSVVSSARLGLFLATNKATAMDLMQVSASMDKKVWAKAGLKEFGSFDEAWNYAHGAEQPGQPSQQPGEQDDGTRFREAGENTIVDNRGIGTTVVTDQEIEAFIMRRGKEPPIEPGMTRLFRGEFPERIDERSAEREMSGRFWTTDLSMASDYGTRIYYKDVPSATVDKSQDVYLASGQPDEIGAKLFSPGPEDMGYDVYDLYENETYRDALALFRSKRTSVSNATITYQQGNDSNATDTQNRQVRAQRLPQGVDGKTGKDHGGKYADVLRRGVSEHADWYADFEQGKIDKEELKFREGRLLAQEAERNGDILPSDEFDRRHSDLVKNVGERNAGGGENVNALEVVDGKRYVVKRNNVSYSNSYLDFFNKIALHNHLFPDTAYEFVGFMYDKAVDASKPGADAALQPVLRQRFVVRDGVATKEEVRAAMEAIGFRDERNGQFVDEKRGIVVLDLDNQNALVDKAGDVAVIDPVIETTERFWSGDTMFREAGEGMDTPEQDAAYLAAVERGDTEATQKMVDAAAKAAGYTVGPVWHAADRRKTRFAMFGHFGTEAAARQRADDLKIDAVMHRAWLRSGEYPRAEDTGTHTPIDIAHELWGKEAAIEAFERYLNAIPSDELPTIAVRAGYPRDVADEVTIEELVASADERYERLNRRPSDIVELLGDPREYIDLNAQMDGETWIRDRASAESIDGLRYRNDVEDRGATSYVVFDPAAIKSADPVTRDDAGNVIPLSERFNEKDDDVRYRLADQSLDESGLGPDDTDIVRTTKAYIDARRKAIQLDPLLESEALHERDAYQAAQTTLALDPNYAQHIIASIVKSPRAVTPEERMMLLIQNASVEYDYSQAIEAGEAAKNRGDDLALADAINRKELATKALEQIDRAIRYAGRESGRSLRFIQASLNKDGSLATMRRRMLAAQNFEPLTEAQEAFIQKKFKALEEVNRKLREHIQELEGKDSHDAAKRGLNKLLLDRKPIDPADKLARAIDVARKLAAQNDGALDEVDIAAFIRKIAKLHVAMGARTVEDLTERIQGSLREVIPQREFSQRFIQDAISQYGKVTYPNPEQDAKTLRDLRQQMMKLSAIEDVLNELAPLKTGPQRDEPSAEVRELTKRLHQLMKEMGINAGDRDSQLKSSLDSIKTRLNNQIEDIERAIANGEPMPEDTRTSVAYDDEAKSLKERRDALKKQYDDMFSVGDSDAAKLQRAIDAAENTLAKWQKIVDDATQGKFKGKKDKPVVPPEVQAIQEKINALKKEHQHLLDLQNPKLSAEEIAMRNYKRGLERSIAKQQEKLDTKNFGPQPKKPPRQLDKKTFELQQKRDAIKAQVDKEEQRWRLAHRALHTKVVDLLAAPTNWFRALASSFDDSAFMRQGGLVLAAHPKIAFRALRKSFKVVGKIHGFGIGEGGEYEAAKIQDEIQSRRNFEKYNIAELYLPSIDADSTLSDAEEDYKLRFYNLFGSDDDPKYGGVVGKAHKVGTKALRTVNQGIRASERLYVSMLNLMRADMFDAMAATSPKGSADLMTDEELKAIGNFINIATGRGKYTEKLTRASNALSTALWSPRNLMARFQFIVGQPFMSGDAMTRKMIAKEYAKMAFGQFVKRAALSMLALGGDDDDDDTPIIETDPRSSDFGKIRIGDTRIDPGSGLNQAFVYSMRMLTNRTKTGRGDLVEIRGKNAGYGQSAQDITERFIRSKLSPTTGIIADMWYGTTYEGTQIAYFRKPEEGEVSALSRVAQLPIPLSIRDVLDVGKEHGIAKGAVLTTLSMLGAGVQVYDNRNYQAAASEFRHYVKAYNAAETSKDRQKVLASAPYLRKKDAINATIRDIKRLEDGVEKLKKNNANYDRAEEAIANKKKLLMNMVFGLDD